MGFPNSDPVCWKPDFRTGISELASVILGFGFRIWIAEIGLGLLDLDSMIWATERWFGFPTLDLRIWTSRSGSHRSKFDFLIWILIQIGIQFRIPIQIGMRKRRAAFWMFAGELLSAFVPPCMDLGWPPSLTQNGQILKSKTNAPCPCKPFFLNTIFFFRKKLLWWWWL